MSRLDRFEAYRYVGARDTMRFYDCDDPSQFQALSDRVAADDLVGRNLLQAFSPDSPQEAASRGFRPAA